MAPHTSLLTTSNTRTLKCWSCGGEEGDYGTVRVCEKEYGR